MHEPPCKSCKYTKELILMGHTLWYGAGKELAPNLTAAWCRNSNTVAGIPCFVQRLQGLTGHPAGQKFFHVCCPFVLGQEQQQKSRDKLLCLGTKSVPHWQFFRVF